MMIGAKRPVVDHLDPIFATLSQASGQYFAPHPVARRPRALTEQGLLATCCWLNVGVGLHSFYGFTNLGIFEYGIHGGL